MNNKWESSKQLRYRISFGVSIFFSLILLASGIGKLLMQEQFSSVVVVYTFLPENLARLVSFCVPIAEITIGAFLLVGLFPKIMAILTIPMSIAYAINNLWLLNLGMKCPSCPHCFGRLEEIFGVLTTMQALYLDILMFLLAMAIIILFPYGFFPLQLWFRKFKATDTETPKPS